MQAAQSFGVPNPLAPENGKFLFAMAAGALFNMPLCGTVSQKPVYIAALSLSMIFTMATGLAPNIGQQLAFRFLAGLFGSTPTTTFGGSITDVRVATERTFVLPAYARLSF